ncbi:MAG TPA: tRNA glutamyl-Q(34) synthetase GluQRS [Pirellulales bacterium]|nr:tRNA glutamyl-Q(34) synthetase GluQRS [Pirellulales bacterium]
MTEPVTEPSDRLIGRLAPSPTGSQHLGNARTYLLAWLSIRSRGGRVVLRIEDIDSPRVKAGAAQQAIDDLHWLGLDWDEGPDVGGPSCPYVQTERRPIYAAALDQLRKADRIYPCTCTRSDVLEAASAPHFEHEGPRYSGTCADRRAADAASLDRPFVWRFRASDMTRVMEDRFAGRVECTVAGELGDFVIARRDGSPSYQLAVVVDDHAMGVSEVLRGDDLVPSAFRQLELYDFFGWSPPAMAHVPLVIGTDGRRLAKRHGDTRLASFREAGCTAEQMVGFLAWSCGLQSEATSVRAADLIPGFCLEKVPRERFVFSRDAERALATGRG